WVFILNPGGPKTRAIVESMVMVDPSSPSRATVVRGDLMTTDFDSVPSSGYFASVVSSSLDSRTMVDCTVSTLPSWVTASRAGKKPAPIGPKWLASSLSTQMPVKSPDGSATWTGGNPHVFR